MGITPSEALAVLAHESIAELQGLKTYPEYNSSGNHDLTHRPADLKSDRAVLAVSKALTILRLVAMLLDPTPENAPPTEGAE